MDINALSAQFLNSPHVPFSASAPAAPGSGNDFTEILRRAQASKAPDSRVNIVRDEKLYEACVELETFLIKNLIKSMRSTVQKTNLIDTGLAGEIYEDMLYDEYSKTFARNAGFGFAEMAYKELSGTLR